jgi:hypothetical protein
MLLTAIRKLCSKILDRRKSLLGKNFIDKFLDV